MSGSSMSLLALLLGVILVCYPLPSHAEVHAPTPQAPSLPAVGARFIRGGGGGGAVTSGAAVVPPPPPPPSLPAVAPTPSAEDKAAKIALILGNRPEELAPVPPANTPTHQFFAASVSQFGTHFNVFKCEDLLNLHHAPLSSTAKAAAAAAAPHPPAPSPSGGALNPTQKNEAAFTENLRALASLDPTHDHFTFYYGSNHQTKMQMVNDHMADVYCYHPLVRITSPTECPSAFYLPPINPHATDDTQRNIVRCTAYPRLGGGNPIAIDTATRRPLAAAALKQNLKFEKRPSSVGFVTLPDKIPHDCGHHLQVSFSISEHATEPRQAVIKQILAKLLRDPPTVQHLTSGEIETPGNERAEAVRIRLCYTGMTGHPFSTRPSKVNGFYKLVDHYRKVMNDLLESGAIKATEHPPFQYRAPSNGMSFTDVTGSPVGSSFAREFCEEAEKYVEGGETYAAFLESFAKCAGAGENRLMLSPSVFPHQCGLPPPTKKHTPAPPPGARQAVVPPHHEDGLTGTKPHAPAPPKEKYEPATRRKDGYSLGAMLVGAHPPAGK